MNESALFLGDPPLKSVRKRRRLRTMLVVLGVVLILLSGLFTVYVADFSRATPAALSALNSDSVVKVTSVKSGYVFVPVGEAQPIGLVVYPGGKVDEKAYAPLCRSLAEAGYPVALVRMPFHLAVFGIGLGADGIRDLESAMMASGKPIPTRFVAAGHSLGGVMAARFALMDVGQVVGVALWAAYSDQDLKPAALPATVIYGSEDKVLDLEAVAKAAGNLPAGTVTTVLDGGNHAGFGDYGAQSGDGTATITKEAQRAAVVEAMKSFLAGLES
jgi:pimeloyl-ACP methyl ester carboxylesterase